MGPESEFTLESPKPVTKEFETNSAQLSLYRVKINLKCLDGWSYLVSILRAFLNTLIGEQVPQNVLLSKPVWVCPRGPQIVNCSLWSWDTKPLTKLLLGGMVVGWFGQYQYPLNLAKDQVAAGGVGVCRCRICGWMKEMFWHVCQLNCDCTTLLCHNGLCLLAMKARLQADTLASRLLIRFTRRAVLCNCSLHRLYFPVMACPVRRDESW